MNNKKSGIPVLSALLRIIIAIVLVFVFFVACNKVRNAFSNEDDKVVDSFEEFADGIIDMSDPKSFELEFKKGTAIMGFRKGDIDVKWDCVNCNPTRDYPRPTSDACVGSACVCLCLEGFSFDSNFRGKCPSALRCKALKRNNAEKDIKEITIIKSNDNDYDDSDDTYWKNGFLFANSVESASGISKISVNKLQLFVDNNNGVIVVCNAEMKTYNEGKFGKPICTTPP